jgi:ribonuclease HI
VPKKSARAPLFSAKDESARPRTDRASALSKGAGAGGGASSASHRWLVYADGASRGNPGPASIGAVVYDESGREAATVSRGLGRGTNNEAEYQAAIAGLEAALELGGGDVELRMDSQLIIRQLQGRYKVRNERLRPFFERILALRARFGSFSMQHVPRERNKRADELANQALDGG